MRDLLMANLEDKEQEKKLEWVNFEVITEVGLRLGWVRSVYVDSNTEQIVLAIAPGFTRWLPELFVSVYELDSAYVVAVNSARLIVAENSEDYLSPVTVGWMEMLGVWRPSWEKDEEIPIYSSRGRNEGWDDDNPGPQPVTNPRRPNPKPTEGAAEIRLE
jgi:hypothetical protein